MGVYDMYGSGNMQLKAGDPEGECFNVGDKVPIEDGIYLCFEGIVVIKEGRMLCEFDTIGNDYPIFDKWGNQIPMDIRPNNPVEKVLNEIERESRQ